MLREARHDRNARHLPLRRSHRPGPDRRGRRGAHPAAHLPGTMDDRAQPAGAALRLPLRLPRAGRRSARPGGPVSAPGRGGRRAPGAALRQPGAGTVHRQRVPAGAGHRDARRPRGVRAGRGAAAARRSLGDALPAPIGPALRARRGALRPDRAAAPPLRARPRRLRQVRVDARYRPQRQRGARRRAGIGDLSHACVPIRRPAPPRGLHAPRTRCTRPQPGNEPPQKPARSHASPSLRSAAAPEPARSRAGETGRNNNSSPRR